jgi:hypothetical protein
MALFTMSENIVTTLRVNVTMGETTVFTEQSMVNVTRERKFSQHSMDSPFGCRVHRVIERGRIMPYVRNSARIEELANIL